MGLPRKKLAILAVGSYAPDIPPDPSSNAVQLRTQCYLAILMSPRITVPISVYLSSFFPDAFRENPALGSAGFAAPSEDTKSQAMRNVCSRSARDIFDNRI